MFILQASSDDGVLRIKPLRELKSLRYDEVAKKDVTVKQGQDYKFEEITGDAVELKVVFEAPLPKEFGIKMLGDEIRHCNDKTSVRSG
jgi:sucrose-6-phosphate hydrolase SacC (GH32 family)